MKHIMIDHFKIWTPWFAWLPIYVGHTRIWWESVERKLKMYGHDPVWEYRLSGGADDCVAIQAKDNLQDQKDMRIK